MKKLKLFIENFVIYGLAGIIAQIVPLIMLPIITRIMPNSSYIGLNDLTNTLVSFGGAFAVMGMYDAMFRMFFEHEAMAYKRSVCSTAFFFTLAVSLSTAAFMVIARNYIAILVFTDVKYVYLVDIAALTTLVTSTNSIMMAPTRMENRRKLYVVMNAIVPAVSYGVAFPLLCKGMYTIALPIGALMSGVLTEMVFYIFNRQWFSLRLFSFKLLPSLLKIGIPLMPNFLVYWLFGSCDKLMISNMLGTAAVGIYTIGSKLGLASQLIYIAFSGGWQYFAFSTMKDDNQVKTNSMIYEYLGIISFACSMLIFAWSYLFYSIVFPESYISGYIIAPYLFLSPLLQMLFQVAANQFVVIRKTIMNGFILSAGVILNVALNYILIPLIGIEGAAIATLSGYIAANIVCLIVLERMHLMELSVRFLSCCIIMVLFVVIWRMWISTNWLAGTALAAVGIGCFLILYRHDIFALLKGLKRSAS